MALPDSEYIYPLRHIPGSALIHAQPHRQVAFTICMAPAPTPPRFPAMNACLPSSLSLLSVPLSQCLCVALSACMPASLTVRRTAIRGTGRTRRTLRACSSSARPSTSASPPTSTPAPSSSLPFSPSSPSAPFSCRRRHRRLSPPPRAVRRRAAAHTERLRSCRRRITAMVRKLYT